MQKNQEIILTVTDYTVDGYGVGKYDSMAVFIPNAAIGDTLKVKILKIKKNYAFAKILEIIEASNQRCEVDCPSFNRCGGCAFRHITYNAECEFKSNKVEQNLRRIGGTCIAPNKIIASTKTDFYRNKAQLPIDQSGNAGFYAFHSHRIVPISECKLQPQIFNEIIAVVEKWVKKYNISVYDEQKNRGLLRHIYLRFAEKTGEIMLCLIINGDKIPFASEFLNALEVFEGIKSVQLNINRSKTNVILGEKCVCLAGEPYINDILCGIKVRLSPMSFYQVNREMAEKLYKKAAEYVKPQNKNIIDLYCGAGTIGLSMANEAKSVIGVEIVPQAVEDAKHNALNNGIKNARFICADAKKAADTLAKENTKADVVIVDPPRKGCEEQLIEIICNSFCPERVVYVSCDSATLARDIKIFGEYGYVLREYTPVDLFPRTAHIETVALLSRQKVNEYINFDVDVANLPKTTRTTATYPEIKAYIKDKYGLCVSSLNIAQVKEKHGLEKRENYNKGKEDHRVPNCTPEKEKAIESAFKHFGMI